MCRLRASGSGGISAQRTAAAFPDGGHGGKNARAGNCAWVFTASAGDIMGAPCTE